MATWLCDDSLMTIFDNFRYMAAEPTIERVQIMYVAAEPEFQESASYV